VGTIDIAWAPPVSGTPTSYVIQAGSAPGRADLANFPTGNTALQFTATNVAAGTYYVRVYSQSSCGMSGPSNEVRVLVVSVSGDVQVQASWDTAADVDLHVVEPNGTEIYYGNRSSATGGQLDVDSNAACSGADTRIENIRWARAPAGTYTVRVDYWSSCNAAQTNYLVTVKNGPATQTFSGSFTGGGDRGAAGGGRLITTFVHAASAVAAPLLELFKAPELFTPSAQKLKVSGGR